MIAEFIFEVLFSTIFGWVGHVVVKAVTLGKVDLDWGSGSESELSGWIGFFVVLFVAGVVAWIWRMS